MSFFARFIMLMLITAHSIFTVFMWVDLFSGAPEVIYEFLELPEFEYNPPFWALISGALFSFLTIASLGVAFWGINSILRNKNTHEFLRLGKQLKQSAWALIVFWISNYLLISILPILLITNSDHKQEYAPEWIPIDFDLVFLVVAIALLAIAGTLQRAHEIEEENNQFL